MIVPSPLCVPARKGWDVVARAMTDRAANAVPVTIITGFLGSGKTTVLNRLLKAPSLADTAVIVNEFGAVGLDHLLIEQAIEDAVLLKNGCICCTVRGDIADTLETLWQRREPTARCRHSAASRSRRPAWPIPRRWRTRCWRRRTPTMPAGWTASSRRWTRCTGAAQLDRQPEARRQVAMADRILLTKTDLASAPISPRSRRRIAALNPSAPVRPVVNGRRDPERRVRSRAGRRRERGPARAMAAGVRADPHHGHRHRPFRHGDEIGSVVLRHEPADRVAGIAALAGVPCCRCAATTCCG